MEAVVYLCCCALLFFLLNFLFYYFPARVCLGVFLSAIVYYSIVPYILCQYESTWSPQVSISRCDVSARLGCQRLFNVDASILDRLIYFCIQRSSTTFLWCKCFLWVSQSVSLSLCLSVSLSLCLSVSLSLCLLSSHALPTHPLHSLLPPALSHQHVITVIYE
jgi:hypothetical protein